MSGNFARGFMETFPTSFAMASKRKQDAWDKTWDKWNQREELDRKARDDFNKVQGEASSIVQTYGQGRVPEGAESLLTEKMMRGMSRQEAIKLVQEGKWTPTELPAGQVNPDRTQQSQAEQQTDAMMGLDQPQMPQQEPQGLLGGLVSQGKSFLQNMRLSPEEKALQDFAKEQGITVDQLKQRMGNGTVSVIPEAEANAQQAQRFNVQMPVPNQEALPGVDVNNVLSRKFQLEDKYRPEIGKIEARSQGLLTILEDTSKNADLVQNNPELLTNYASTFAQTAINLRQELQAFGTMFKEQGEEAGKNALANTVDSLTKNIAETEKTLEGSILDGPERIAKAKELFDMRVKLSAYTLASMYAQEGRSLAEAERLLFQEIFKPGINPETYLQNMNALIQREIGITDRAIQSLASRQDIADYNTLASQASSNPILQLQMPKTTITDRIQGTPQGEYLKQLRAAKPDITDSAQQTQNKIPKGFILNGRTKDGRPIYKTPDGQLVVGK